MVEINRLAPCLFQYIKIAMILDSLSLHYFVLPAVQTANQSPDILEHQSVITLISTLTLEIPLIQGTSLIPTNSWKQVQNLLSKVVLARG